MINTDPHLIPQLHMSFQVLYIWMNSVTRSIFIYKLVFCPDHKSEYSIALFFSWLHVNEGLPVKFLSCLCPISFFFKTCIKLHFLEILKWTILRYMFFRGQQQLNVKNICKTLIIQPVCIVFLLLLLTQFVFSFHITRDIKWF